MRERCAADAHRRTDQERCGAKYLGLRLGPMTTSSQVPTSRATGKKVSRPLDSDPTTCALPRTVVDARLNSLISTTVSGISPRSAGGGLGRVVGVPVAVGCLRGPGTVTAQMRFSFPRTWAGPRSHSERTSTTKTSAVSCWSGLALAPPAWLVHTMRPTAGIGFTSTDCAARSGLGSSRTAHSSPTSNDRTGYTPTTIRLTSRHLHTMSCR